MNGQSRSAGSVSVVIASYNHARFIQRAITSVIEQTYEPLEIILIDDHSTDDTFAIAEAALVNARNRFVRVVIERNAFNMGAARTFNRGISLTTGDYVSFLNSDDEYAHERLTVLVDRLRQEKAEWAFSGVYPIDDGGTPSFRTSFAHRVYWSGRLAATTLPSVSWGFLPFQLAITTGNLLLTSSLLQTIGGFAELAYCHDWDFALRCLFVAEPQFVAQDLYRYRLHAANSFNDLASVADAETAYCLEGHFRRVMGARPPNALAPSPQNWPTLFEPLVNEMGIRRHLDALYRPYRPGHRTIDATAVQP